MQSFLSAASFVLAVLAALSLGPVASSQETSSEGDIPGYVRVTIRHVNVHMGPTTARPVLVLAPKDTVFRVTGRRGEWLEVELEPELRKTGMVMRWYENEDRGWVHESTVEPVEAGEETR